jgi:hypothetical protein
MADQDDVREIALALPGVTEERGRFAFNVQGKGKAQGIVWVWLERVHPKKARVPNPSAIGVRVRDQADKAALLAGDPDVFFTEPHYDGYPAVLVRLAAVSRKQLQALIPEAWRCQAPKKLIEAAGEPPPRKPPARRRTARS